MSPLTVWLIGYAAPAIFAGTVLKVLPRHRRKLNARNAIIIHGALILSILVSQYCIRSRGFVFPWHLDVLSVGAYLLSIVLATVMVGRLGFLYGLSALVQQLAMLSMTFLLLPAYPFYVVVALIVPIYAYCHVLKAHHWLLREELFLVWGAVSIWVFSVFPDVFLIVAVHAFLGAALISMLFLYPRN